MEEKTNQAPAAIDSVVQPKKRNASIVIITIISIICVLLATALVVSLIAIYEYKNDTVKVGQTIVDGIVQPSPDSSETPPPSIPVSQLKQYASQYSVSAEFLQRFFTNEIVYKNNSGIVYEPIDESLAKNGFDFDKLVYQDREIQYHENGAPITIKGIDVSKYQGDIDWKKVAADGVKYAFIRIGVRGYGTGAIVEDEKWERNIKGAIAAGVDVGAYFYSQAITVEEAIEEAQFVLERVKPYKITYPIVFDFEEVNDEGSRTLNLTQQERTDFTIAFCDTIKQAGYETMVYGNIKWFIEMVDMTRLTQYDKWFAQYYKTPFFPYELSMWQYTGKGKVDGIKGDCDLNISFKDYATKDETSSDTL